MGKKVAIIGCGRVGMALAYSLVTSNDLVSELVLIDIAEEKVTAEYLDLAHAAERLNHKITIKVNDYDECSDADVIALCFCAASGRATAKKDRRELGKANCEAVKNIVARISKTGFKGIFLVATNPLDVIVQAVYKLSGFPAHRVIGSGATLDTARLHHSLKIRGIPVDKQSCYIFGEHGNSMMVPWSLDKNLQNLSSDKKTEILDEVRRAGYAIVTGKGYTNYGIGACLYDLVNAILSDKKIVDVVSFYCELHDACYSRRAVIGKDGIVKEVPTDMNEEDKNNLLASISAIRSCIEEIDEFGQL